MRSFSMSSFRLITDVQMRDFMKPHKWKCPILSQFHEGYVIHVGTSGMIKRIDNESRENELCLLWTG